MIVDHRVETKNHDQDMHNVVILEITCIRWTKTCYSVSIVLAHERSYKRKESNQSHTMSARSVNAATILSSSIFVKMRVFFCPEYFSLLRRIPSKSYNSCYESRDYCRPNSTKLDQNCPNTHLTKCKVVSNGHQKCNKRSFYT